MLSSISVDAASYETSSAEVYLADSDNFLRHMLTLRDLQASDGRFTDTEPINGASATKNARLILQRDFLTPKVTR